MSLWVDKYRPKELSKLDYHLEQADHLKKLVSWIIIVFFKGHVLMFGYFGFSLNFLL